MSALRKRLAVLRTSSQDPTSDSRGASAVIADPTYPTTAFTGRALVLAECDRPAVILRTSHAQGTDRSSTTTPIPLNQFNLGFKTVIALAFLPNPRRSHYLASGETGRYPFLSASGAAFRGRPRKRAQRVYTVGCLPEPWRRAGRAARHAASRTQELIEMYGPRDHGGRLSQPGSIVQATVIANWRISDCRLGCDSRHPTKHPQPPLRFG